ncbi:hypothetical protein JCM15548_1996 [Geofilum rubicundum JCM 15548]|uniref:Uncharacterized protein n=1 Tax=Geofilum rubicundum JCM 15548 TaxID=1236989 RepID=A0A0E9LUS5_9BACT|nr:hypothetical protein JCM15548_1996 [Geofilum rubicundum JCM 15548]
MSGPVHLIGSVWIQIPLRKYRVIRRWYIRTSGVVTDKNHFTVPAPVPPSAHIK